jgi:hypothetical protein
MNNGFVMYQWGLTPGLKNLKLLPDGCGRFTRLMRMLVDKDKQSAGKYLLIFLDFMYILCSHYLNIMENTEWIITKRLQLQNF